MESERSFADDGLLDAVRHLARTHILEHLAQRFATFEDERAARRAVAVDDDVLAVVGVQACEQGGVALLDAAAQRVAQFGRLLPIGDRVHGVLFGGSHSSTRLPSGSMTQPNFP